MNVCHGCGCKFYVDGYPKWSSDLVIVSSMRWSFIDLNNQGVVSLQFSKVYYDFNYSCITVHNHFFAPPLIIIPEDLKLYSSPVHKEGLIASQTQIKGTVQAAASVVFCSYSYISYKYTQVANIQCSSASKYIQNQLCYYCERKTF